MYKWGQPWPTQDIVLCLGLCARINTILCAPTLCLGTPPDTVTARTITQYIISPRPPVIAIYTTQYWQLQNLVKAKVNRIRTLPPLLCAGAAEGVCVYIYIYMIHSNREYNTTSLRLETNTLLMG